ncbi:MAG: hypothetical protein WC308_00295 [archaeon]|jgi:hypothetical protein
MKDEEVAFRIVRLYFEEIARLGFKRQLDLDQMINSYFYSLNRLKNKDDSMRKFERKIIEEQNSIACKEVVGAEKFASEVSSAPVQGTTVKRTEIVEETTSSAVAPPSENAPVKSKTITEIIEEEK